MISKTDTQAGALSIFGSRMMTSRYCPVMFIDVTMRLLLQSLKAIHTQGLSLKWSNIHTIICLKLKQNSKFQCAIILAGCQNSKYHSRWLPLLLSYMKLRKVKIQMQQTFKTRSLTGVNTGLSWTILECCSTFQTYPGRTFAYILIGLLYKICDIYNFQYSM
jgi:hypothetical protein